MSGIDHKRLTTLSTLAFGFPIMNRTILDGMVRTTTRTGKYRQRGNFVLC
jgi:hypothetical protein